VEAIIQVVDFKVLSIFCLLIKQLQKPLSLQDKPHPGDLSGRILRYQAALSADPIKSACCKAFFVRTL
jgi:hypothetical protein